jgi:hypothetical protein
MGLLDRFIGRKSQDEIGAMIRELNESALREPNIQDLSAATTVVWNTLCDGATDTLSQLVVRNSNNRLDWGLKRHRRQINHEQLLTMYWWMLLYQVLLLQHRGLDGRSTKDDLPMLEATAHRFLARHVTEFSFPTKPNPWSDQWNRQFALEAAMDIYNGVYEMLGLFNDLNKRINYVSNFTSATEQSFDNRAKNLRD